MILLVFIAYEVIAILAARSAYPRLDPDNGDVADKFCMAAVSLIFGQFWPLAAPIALILWKPRKTPEQVAAENEQMRKRIAQLERELGIGGRT